MASRHTPLYFRWSLIQLDKNCQVLNSQELEQVLGLQVLEQAFVEHMMLHSAL
jgi:hypothetical protein